MRPNKTGADGKPKVPGANKDEQLKTQTFIDKEKGIVVRIVRNLHTSKLYLFPVHAIAQNRVAITILPSGNKYVVPDIDYPLVVNDLPAVEEVGVEIG